MKCKRLTSIALMLLLVALTLQGQEQQFVRLKGYYRVYQATNAMLAYFIDGMVEMYVPIADTSQSSSSTTHARSTFVDRKFLGERRCKAPQANGDETFVRMNMPQLETIPLVESINSEEYSTRNNGDVYRWADKCGQINHHRLDNEPHTNTGLTIEIDNLTGQPNHELELNQLKMYGIVARMTAFEESETYAEQNARNYTLADLHAAHKHQTFMAHYRGEDEDEQIDVWSDFFVTDKMVISEREMKRIKKEKPQSRTFTIPSSVPQLEENIAEAWAKMVEY